MQNYENDSFGCINDKYTVFSYPYLNNYDQKHSQWLNRQVQIPKSNIKESQTVQTLILRRVQRMFMEYGVKEQEDTEY